jgi:23S rRNA (cytosine1962-C5)-methyltransferase
MKTATVILKPGKDGPLRRFHPWVFSGAIQRLDGKPADGDLVQVRDKHGDLLGVGHYHEGSIAVRLLDFGDANPQEMPFWVDRLQQARQVRHACIDPRHTDAYRLVHGEGDGLSGLIVDIYSRTAVVQCHSIGMHRQRALIAQALMHVLDKELDAVYDKSVESLPPVYAATQQNGYLIDPPEASETTIVKENNVSFKIDWVTGQKTGFFLDQRDNRQLIASFSRGNQS